MTTSPRTASPRNSSRSFEPVPGFSAHQDRWASDRVSRSASPTVQPRRPASSLAGDGSGAGTSGSVGCPRCRDGGRYPAEGGQAGAQLCHHVVDRVANRLQVLEVLVVDAKSDGPLGQLLLERLHQLDEGQGVGAQVVAEGRPFRDRVGADFQDVGQAAPDELDHLLAVEWAAFDVGLGGQGVLLGSLSGCYRRRCGFALRDAAAASPSRAEPGPTPDQTERHGAGRRRPVAAEKPSALRSVPGPRTAS